MNDPADLRETVLDDADGFVCAVLVSDDRAWNERIAAAWRALLTEQEEREEKAA